MAQAISSSSSNSPSRPRQKPTTLILVCCHAIFIGPATSTSISPNQSSSHQNTQLNPYDPAQWLLQPFQATEAPTFVEHIRTGLNLLQADPASIFVFSGGRTRNGSGCEVSEAEGYARVARWVLESTQSGNSDNEDREDTALDEDVQNIMNRVYLEEYATDSFQNVLFALLGWSVWSTRSQSQLHSNGSVANSTGLDFPNLPKRLIVVSHAFKRVRFMELHLLAIQELLDEKGRHEFERMEIEYVGIDPPFSAEGRRKVEEGERVRGYEPWVEDRFGTGKILDGKRKARGWDGGVGYLDWWREQLGVNVRRKEDVQEVVKEVESIVHGRLGREDDGMSEKT